MSGKSHVGNGIKAKESMSLRCQLREARVQEAGTDWRASGFISVQSGKSQGKVLCRMLYSWSLIVERTIVRAQRLLDG